MVQTGLAVVPWEISKSYLNEQEQAKSAGRGVWAGSFELPWNFRNRRPNVVVVRQPE
jgi:endonuclease YncB( thermonuclease family)